MAKYKAVLFDLDGTLLDTIEDLKDSMNTVLQEEGLPERTLEEIRCFIGNGMKNLVRLSLPENRRDEPTVVRLLNAMQKAYAAHWNVHSRPYPLVCDLLDSLTGMGIRMAVLSNKVDSFTKQMVQTLLPQFKFEVILGERPGIPRKPDTTAALEIADLMKLTPEEFLYLGDAETDIKTALGAGMLPVGALWGYRTADDLRKAGAKLLIEKPTDLLALL